MPNGFGFGFRGASPPWPYVGRGRGGLPRCWYYGVGMAPSYGYAPVPYPPYAYGGAWTPPSYGGYPAPGAMPYPPEATPAQELDFLKDQAKMLKEELEDIETRIRELEQEE